MIHKLKTIDPFFTDVWEGKKTFEIRKDDRGFQVGDTLYLDEFYPDFNQYGDCVL